MVHRLWFIQWDSYINAKWWWKFADLLPLENVFVSGSLYFICYLVWCTIFYHHLWLRANHKLAVFIFWTWFADSQKPMMKVCVCLGLCTELKSAVNFLLKWLHLGFNAGLHKTMLRQSKTFLPVDCDDDGHMAVVLKSWSCQSCWGHVGWGSVPVYPIHRQLSPSHGSLKSWQKCWFFHPQCTSPLWFSQFSHCTLQPV